MTYILVVDDEADIRDIFEIILKRTYSLNVLTAESGNKALKVIEEHGRPEIIISDLHMSDGDGVFLYTKLKEQNSKVPFIICTTDTGDVLKRTFPDIYGFIEKPDVVTSARNVLGGLIKTSNAPLDYIPVRISLLLRWGTTNFDLYMKLSESKFVKVVNAGEAFMPADAERFLVKGLHHLHITASDADSYIKDFENNISMLVQAEEKESTQLPVISLESLETVERIARALGWTAEVLDAAKSAVNLAVKAVQREPNLMKLLKQKMRNTSSNYSHHVSLLSLISCGVCHNLGWTSESTQMKLGMAALLHDLTVEESYYLDINLWNHAAEANEKTPEVIKYRNHPADAANLILNMKNVPPDVDQIILQHHEARDGSGFPRGLISSRISPMACVFIITEDLINYVEGVEDMDERIQRFIKLREDKYSSGNFKKVFEAFKESVEKERV